MRLLPWFPITGSPLTTKQLNLFAAFGKRICFRWMTGERSPSWRAMPWETGGSAAIVLKNPKDALTLATVRTLLGKLAADPANGIDRVLEGDELHRRGGYPNASFFVGLKPGWRTGSALSGPVVSSVKAGGTHGELPDLADLRAAFFPGGAGRARGEKSGPELICGTSRRPWLKKQD